MGPEAVLALFKHFENAPDQYKYAIAPNAILIARDTRAQLECLVDPCDDLQARKDAMDYMITYMEDYLPVVLP